ncbi:microtubule associated protein (MAP65/ASE1 family) domain-containing protein [Ditylenchus destructor]|uniref:Microtubule associated protein (MAP65/ASE1 family) domain-containing protein n=1 Tax=Ditylenchus destructor TaxID=166010 RepID=A0AAD4NBY5_9BILA|nr:microtubule associated protein (MAP65/ASE1 family) domain-containing protein [Ditylenchus destructor]
MEKQPARRRMSVEDSTARLIQAIHQSLDQLTILWDQVHMETVSREARIECAYEHFHNLLRDIVSSEEEMIQNVGKDIAARRLAVADLRKLFKMSEFDESQYPSGSIALLKALDKDLAVLREGKEKIIQKQLDVYNEMEELCKRSGAEMIKVDDIMETILSDQELEEMRQWTSKIRRELKERIQTIVENQDECRKIHKTLGINSVLTEEELYLLDCDFHAPDAAATDEILEKFMSLCQKLKDQHDVWIEQVAFRYDELLVKLEELSQKCFLANRRFYPSSFDPENQDNNDIVKIESEIEALEEKYQRGRPVFDKLGEWMDLWQEKLRTEQKACRASFYNNRGGSIAATLKRQKQVNNQMTKIFDELKTLVQEYVDNNYEILDIQVEGLLPHKYAEFVMEEYERDKEVQRAQKQLTKKQSNETGTLRSAKRPPVFNSNTAPRSARKRSFSCSQLSVISPTHGPITSSPMLDPSATLCSMANAKTLSKTPSKTGASVHKTPSRSGRANAVLTPSGKSSNRPWY